MEITLPGGRKIGAGHPVFIVAEVGSNWTSLDDCLDSIVKAKQCGADAVKFQLFDEIALYGIPLCTASIHKNVSDSMRESIRAASLQIDWFPKLKAHADVHGIEFMCTAFSPELYDAMDPYVSIHKVASAECTHIRILEKLRGCGKPVILSTGAKGRADIDNALTALTGQPYDRDASSVILMYCVAAYPANEINLDGIHWLKNTFKTLVGYSDHSPDVLIMPKAAVKTGACVIEKHVTFIEADTPDAPHSLSGEQFRGMVDMIRGRMTFNPGPTKDELPMVLRHNRRLIATRDVAEGEKLVSDDNSPNFGIYRSLKDDSHAFSPFMINEVHGKIAKRPIKAGDGIGPGDI